MKDTLVIYHSPCLDGFTSAWAAWRKLGDTADYIPGSYNNNKNDPTDFTDKTVYFVDYSVKRDEMLAIAKLAKEVIILDHHKTAIEDLSELYEQGVIKGVFDLDRSGAGITWDYFFPNEPRPTIIDYVEDRDLWRFNLPFSREMNAALFSYDYSFETWNSLYSLCEARPQMVQYEGSAILRKHMKDVRELSKQSQRMSIGGHVVPAVNANYTYGSDIGSLLSEDEKFAAYYWINSEGRYAFGLFSQPDGEDVSKIAALYGGGGHKTAAGFIVNTLDDLNQ